MGSEEKKLKEEIEGRAVDIPFVQHAPAALERAAIGSSPAPLPPKDMPPQKQRKSIAAELWEEIRDIIKVPLKHLAIFLVYVVAIIVAQAVAPFIHLPGLAATAFYILESVGFVLSIAILTVFLS